MSSSMYYRQCTLRRGCEQQVRWIPETFARVGKWIVVKEDGSNWCVKEVGAMRVSEEYLAEHERDHLHQREASDV